MGSHAVTRWRLYASHAALALPQSRLSPLRAPGGARAIWPGLLRLLFFELERDLHFIVIDSGRQTADLVHRRHDVAPRHAILEVDEDHTLGSARRGGLELGAQGAKQIGGVERCFLVVVG